MYVYICKREAMLYDMSLFRKFSQGKLLMNGKGASTLGFVRDFSGISSGLDNKLEITFEQLTNDEGRFILKHFIHLSKEQISLFLIPFSVVLIIILKIVSHLNAV